MPPQHAIDTLIARFHQGQLELVKQQAMSLLANFPGAWVLHNILGAAQAGLGNLEAATASYRKALRINPAYAEAFNNLGNALQEQGRTDEAITSYKEALHFKPDHADAHFNLGMALKSKGRLEEAMTSFTRALQFRPDDAETHFNLGILQRETGRLEEAAASYTRSLRYKPNFAEAHRNLSTLKTYRAGDPQIAQMQWLINQQALSDQDRMYLCFALGKASDDIGDHDAAFRHLSAGNRLRWRDLNHDIAAERKLFAWVKAAFETPLPA